MSQNLTAGTYGNSDITSDNVVLGQNGTYTFNTVYRNLSISLYSGVTAVTITNSNFPYMPSIDCGANQTVTLTNNTFNGGMNDDACLRTRGSSNYHFTLTGTANTFIPYSGGNVWIVVGAASHYTFAPQIIKLSPDASYPLSNENSQALHNATIKYTGSGSYTLDGTLSFNATHIADTNGLDITLTMTSENMQTFDLSNTGTITLSDCTFVKYLLEPFVVQSTGDNGTLIFDDSNNTIDATGDTTIWNKTGSHAVSGVPNIYLPPNVYTHFSSDPEFIQNSNFYLQDGNGVTGDYTMATFNGSPTFYVPQTATLAVTANRAITTVISDGATLTLQNSTITAGVSDNYCYTTSGAGSLTIGDNDVFIISHGNFLDLEHSGSTSYSGTPTFELLEGSYTFNTDVENSAVFTYGVTLASNEGSYTITCNTELPITMLDSISVARLADCVFTAMPTITIGPEQTLYISNSTFSPAEGDPYALQTLGSGDASLIFDGSASTITTGGGSELWNNTVPNVSYDTPPNIDVGPGTYDFDTFPPGIDNITLTDSPYTFTNLNQPMTFDLGTTDPVTVTVTSNRMPTFIINNDQTLNLSGCTFNGYTDDPATFQTINNGTLNFISPQTVSNAVNGKNEWLASGDGTVNYNTTPQFNLPAGTYDLSSPDENQDVLSIGVQLVTDNGTYNISGINNDFNASVGGPDTVLDYNGIGGTSNGSVYVLAKDNSGNIYAGGDFTQIGGVSASKIAKYDGTSWTALGSGLNNTCYAIYVDDSGNVYAGGSFTTAGGISANYIAKYDGTSWTALGNLNGNVRAITLYNGNITAGGYFTQDGETTLHYVAYWDGTNWNDLGQGTNSSVLALSASGSNLYVGGLFTSLGGGSINTNGIAKFNGVSWNPFATGVNNGGYVNALFLDGSGNLYIGGSFTSVGGTSASNIATWTGASWSAVGNGLYKSNHTGDVVLGIIGTSSSNIYACGRFDTSGSSSLSGLAHWNGTSWNESTSSVRGAITGATDSIVLGSDNIILYAGGSAGNENIVYELLTEPTPASVTVTITANAMSSFNVSEGSVLIFDNSYLQASEGDGYALQTSGGGTIIFRNRTSRIVAAFSSNFWNNTASNLTVDIEPTFQILSGSYSITSGGTNSRVFTNGVQLTDTNGSSYEIDDLDARLGISFASGTTTGTLTVNSTRMPTVTIASGKTLTLDNCNFQGSTSDSYCLTTSVSGTLVFDGTTSLFTIANGKNFWNSSGSGTYDYEVDPTFQMPSGSYTISTSTEYAGVFATGITLITDSGSYSVGGVDSPLSIWMSESTSTATLTMTSTRMPTLYTSSGQSLTLSGCSFTGSSSDAFALETQNEGTLTFAGSVSSLNVYNGKNVWSSSGAGSYNYTTPPRFNLPQGTYTLGSNNGDFVGVFVVGLRLTTNAGTYNVTINDNDLSSQINMTCASGVSASVTLATNPSRAIAFVIPSGSTVTLAGDINPNTGRSGGMLELPYDGYALYTSGAGNLRINGLTVGIASGANFWNNSVTGTLTFLSDPKFYMAAGTYDITTALEDPNVFTYGISLEPVDDENNIVNIEACDSPITITNVNNTNPNVYLSGFFTRMPTLISQTSTWFRLQNFTSVGSTSDNYALTTSGNSNFAFEGSVKLVAVNGKNFWHDTNGNIYVDVPIYFALDNGTYTLSNATTISQVFQYGVYLGYSSDNATVTINGVDNNLTVNMNNSDNVHTATLTMATTRMPTLVVNNDDDLILSGCTFRGSADDDYALTTSNNGTLEFQTDTSVITSYDGKNFWTSTGEGTYTYGINPEYDMVPGTYSISTGTEFNKIFDVGILLKTDGGTYVINDVDQPLTVDMKSGNDSSTLTINASRMPTIICNEGQTLTMDGSQISGDNTDFFTLTLTANGSLIFNDSEVSTHLTPADGQTALLYINGSGSVAMTSAPQIIPSGSQSYGIYSDMSGSCSLNIGSLNFSGLPDTTVPVYWPSLDGPFNSDNLTPFTSDLNYVAVSWDNSSLVYYRNGGKIYNDSELQNDSTEISNNTKYLYVAVGKVAVSSQDITGTLNVTSSDLLSSNLDTVFGSTAFGTGLLGKLPSNNTGTFAVNGGDSNRLIRTPLVFSRDLSDPTRYVGGITVKLTYTATSAWDNAPWNYQYVINEQGSFSMSNDSSEGGVSVNEQTGGTGSATFYFSNPLIVPAYIRPTSEDGGVYFLQYNAGSGYATYNTSTTYLTVPAGQTWKTYTFKSTGAPVNWTNTTIDFKPYIYTDFNNQIDSTESIYFTNIADEYVLYPVISVAETEQTNGSTSFNLNQLVGTFNMDNTFVVNNTVTQTFTLDVEVFTKPSEGNQTVVISMDGSDSGVLSCVFLDGESSPLPTVSEGDYAGKPYITLTDIDTSVRVIVQTTINSPAGLDGYYMGSDVYGVVNFIPLESVATFGPDGSLVDTQSPQTTQVTFDVMIPYVVMIGIQETSTSNVNMSVDTDVPATGTFAGLDSLLTFDVYLSAKANMTAHVWFNSWTSDGYNQPYFINSDSVISNGQSEGYGTIRVNSDSNIWGSRTYYISIDSLVLGGTYETLQNSGQLNIQYNETGTRKLVVYGVSSSNPDCENDYTATDSTTTTSSDISASGEPPSYAPASIYPRVYVSMVTASSPHESDGTIDTITAHFAFRQSDDTDIDIGTSEGQIGVFESVEGGEVSSTVNLTSEDYNTESAHVRYLDFSQITPLDLAGDSSHKIINVYVYFSGAGSTDYVGLPTSVGDSSLAFQVNLSNTSISVVDLGIWRMVPSGDNSLLFQYNDGSGWSTKGFLANDRVNGPL